MTATISTRFAPVVDEFITDLHTFATGSYLSAEDKEFWDAPFDAAVLPELRSILTQFLANADALGDTASGEDLVACITRFIDAARAFNARHADAVIEPEEYVELNELILNVADATGIDYAPEPVDEASESNTEDGTENADAAGVTLPLFD